MKKINLNVLLAINLFVSWVLYLSNNMSFSGLKWITLLSLAIFLMKRTKLIILVLIFLTLFLPIVAYLEQDFWIYWGDSFLVWFNV